MFVSCMGLHHQMQSLQTQYLKKPSKLRRLIINVTILYYMGIYQNATVDYPSRSFCNPLIYWIAAINGTLFIQNLSKLIVRIPLKFRNWLTVLGQCSIGILFFHLFFFKIVFLCFINVILLRVQN